MMGSSSGTGEADPIFGLFRRALSDLLGGAAGIKKVEADLNAEIGKLTEARDRLKGETNGLNAVHATAKAAADDYLAKAQATAAEASATAVQRLEHAEQVLADAKSQGATIVATAKEQAKAAVQAEIEAIKRRL